MGGTTSQQTSTQNSSPWSSQQPYLEKGFSDAQKIYDKSGPSYFPGSTVTPFSQNQNNAFGMGANLARQGDPNVNAASAQNQNILKGNYGNDVFKNIESQVLPSVNSQFEGAGRYGSDSHATAAATGLTNAYAPFAASMMNQAIDRAPSFQNQQWNNVNNLADIGKQQQGLGQQENNDAINRFNYYQNLPQLKLNQFQQNVGGNWGGTSTTSTPVYQPSIFSQIGGAALGLGGLFG